MNWLKRWWYNLFCRKKQKEALFTLEEALLAADLGPEAVQSLLAHRDETKIRAVLLERFQTEAHSLDFNQRPGIILMVGVNGVGKTTTVAKLVHYYQNQGKKVLLAAADTFRAAAIEQLQVWGERLGVEVVAQAKGADAAAVAFDAISKAKAKDYDLVIVDTAGRQHTKANLMEELKKIKRVAQKAADGLPIEIWLTLEAQVGQTGLMQAREFHQALGLTGSLLTKMDGTAKGGILFSITKEMQIPVLFLGVGEGLEDLKPFHPQQFVSNLFKKE